MMEGWQPASAQRSDREVESRARPSACLGSNPGSATPKLCDFANYLILFLSQLAYQGSRDCKSTNIIVLSI